MVLYSISWDSMMILRGITWYSMVLHGPELQLQLHDPAEVILDIRLDTGQCLAE